MGVPSFAQKVAAPLRECQDEKSGHLLAASPVDSLFIMADCHHPSFLSTFAILMSFTLLISQWFPLLPSVPTTYDGDEVPSCQRPIPKRIWQSWKLPLQLERKTPGLRRLSLTWPSMNPLHRYELLTDDSAETYVRDNFMSYPEIVDLYLRISHPILRADLLRYLVLWHDGGLWSDIDTSCTKPIDEWIPDDMRDSVGVVLGMESDGPLRNDPEHPDVRFGQYTIMSKPGHRVMERVVEETLLQLRTLDNGANTTIRAPTTDVVFNVTGPTVSTKSIPVSSFPLP